MKTKISFFLLFSFVSIVVFKLVIYQMFDKPQACTWDNGKTISYFEIPSADKKEYAKIFPGTKEFKKILDGGDYDYTNIAPPWFTKEMLK
jgi:hypothetical protein